MEVVIYHHFVDGEPVIVEGLIDPACRFVLQPTNVKVRDREFHDDQDIRDALEAAATAPVWTMVRESSPTTEDNLIDAASDGYWLPEVWFEHHESRGG